MDIELLQGGVKAIIDLDGAWVTNLSDDNGDILFPKRSLRLDDGSKKTRGGLHVCLPNFGPGGDSGLPQHGFGREKEWIIRARSDASITLELAGVGEGYESLHSQLVYTLKPSELTAELTVNNQGDQDLRLAPAFHPYFMTFGGSVTLDGELQDLNDVAEAQFIKGDAHHLQFDSRKVTIAADNLPTWAVWTDQLGNYVCVEPTTAGFSFNEHAADAAELLAPEQVKTYTCSIKWA